MSHCLEYKHCVSMLPNSTTDLRNIKGNFPLDSSGSPSSGAYPNLRSMKRMLPLPPEVDALPSQYFVRFPLQTRLNVLQKKTKQQLD